MDNSILLATNSGLEFARNVIDDQSYGDNMKMRMFHLLATTSDISSAKSCNVSSDPLSDEDLIELVDALSGACLKYNRDIRVVFGIICGSTPEKDTSIHAEYCLDGYGILIDIIKYVYRYCAEYDRCPLCRIELMTGRTIASRRDYTARNAIIPDPTLRQDDKDIKFVRRPGSFKSWCKFVGGVVNSNMYDIDTKVAVIAYFMGALKNETMSVQYDEKHDAITSLTIQVPITPEILSDTILRIKRRIRYDAKQLAGNTVVDFCGNEIPNMNDLYDCKFIAKNGEYLIFYTKLLNFIMRCKFYNEYPLVSSKELEASQTEVIVKLNK